MSQKPPLNPIISQRNATQTSIPQQPWMSTFTGRRFSFSNPQVDQVCLEDIAHALAIEPRFGGQSNFHWSVASHSLLCAEAAKHYWPIYNPETPSLPPDLIAATLLHDASEAYHRDLITPFMAMFPDVKAYVTNLQAFIDSIYALSISQEETEFLHKIDTGVCYAEATALLHNGIKDWEQLKPHIKISMAELKYQIYERPISAVKGMFLRQLRQYICE